MRIAGTSIGSRRETSDEDVELQRKAENNRRRRSHTRPFTALSNEESHLHQNGRLLLSENLAMKYEIRAPNESICALMDDKDTPNLNREKRRKIVKPDTFAGSKLAKVNSLKLNTWLETLQDDTKPNNAVDIQGTVESAKLQPLSANKGADVKPIRPSKPASSIPGMLSTAPDTSLKPADSTTHLEATKISERDDEAKPDTNGKLLRLNSNGKLGPSPGKPRRSDKMTLFQPEQCDNPNKLIIILQFGREEDTRRKFAELINKSTNHRNVVPNPEYPQKFGVSAKLTASGKNVHPFFTNKKKSAPHKDVQHLETQLLKSAITPGKLKAQRRDCIEVGEQEKSLASPMKKSARNLPKADTKLHTWPSRTNLHVRGLPHAEDKHPSPQLLAKLSFKQNRKRKGFVVTVPKNEDIIQILSQDFRSVTTSKRETLPDSAVRALPTREITTGPDLVKWFSSRLFGLIDSANQKLERDRDFATIGEVGLHPALERLHGEMESTLTPFDRFTCESMTWASKHSPKKAEQVLQSDNHAPFIGDWLKSLTLKTAQKPKIPSDNSNLDFNRSFTSRRQRSRKKRKRDSLDGFITSSDDESDKKGELSETSSEKSLLASVNRNSVFTSDTSRSVNVSNSILISGPHGCGKTAAVYAAAEELGFEIFEVHSGSRRSGRDLLDRVGEMAENHLVQSVPGSSSTKIGNKYSTLDADNPERVEENMSQRSMMSFFSTKTRPLSSKNALINDHEENLNETSMKPQVREPRKQKQSLILLEEADILFDEDKQFWPTVVSLLLSSKRPVIITCTDENAIPHDLMNFKAILRFTPPPREIAVSYLMLLAGNEGHKLTRETVSDVYDQTNHDLRASIMTLNFWCQMGIGDKKGGLDWMINRWPPGADVDKLGRKLRVVSNGSYESVTSLLQSDLCSADTSIIYDRDYESLRVACGSEKLNIELLYDVISHYDHDTDSGSIQYTRNNLSSYQELADAQTMSEMFSSADCFTREVLHFIL